jgi:hypothetical protein
VANPGWPVSLPPPLVAGISYSSAPNVIRSQMDAGAAKVRRRFTAVPETVAFSLVLTEAQVQVLQDFVEITLSDVLPFDWIDFRKPSGTAVTYRFTKRPAYTPRDQTGRYWTAQVELEQLTTSQGTYLLDVSPLTT